ncbi:hypothetical protein ACWEOE_31700 [Amycolatopsis sp. NPDC004368]
MRRAALHEHVTTLITNTWGDTDPSLVEDIVDDEDAFGALCHRLNIEGDGKEDGIADAWNATIEQIDDNTIDWLAEQAESPAAYLASRV